jgi:PPM family protein phosphatase
MQVLKNSGRARVVNAFDGRVIKCFNGPNAAKRFQNECRLLRHLNQLECPFVPRMLDSDSSRLSITTEYCGQSIDWLSEEQVEELFGRLLTYGVRHHDPALRNILFDSKANEFMLIDFELADVSDKFLSAVPRLDRSFHNAGTLLQYMVDSIEV